MIAFSFKASSFLLTLWTRQPGPGSRSIWVPPRFSQAPPEARNCLVTTKRAPAVPRKVIVSVSSSTVHNYSKKSHHIFSLSSSNNGAYNVFLPPLAGGSLREGEQTSPFRKGR